MKTGIRPRHSALLVASCWHAMRQRLHVAMNRDAAVLRCGTALLLCCALLAAPARAQGERRVALLIGNADYTHERKLRNPVNDAELLGQVLKDELGFDMVRVERNLNASRFDGVLDEFVRQAGKAATVVFYFSGHGLTGRDPVGDKHAFLLPVDAHTGAPDSPSLDRQAVKASQVRQRLQKLGARITLLILDACRDGPGADRAGGDKGLTRIGGGNQLLVAYATEEGRTAKDGEGTNSPYAEALARAWRQRDKSVLQQLDFVSDEVTRQVPGQEPTREGNLRADAYLANPFGPVRPQDRQRIEDEAWAMCRGAATLVPCEDYLRGWQQGRYRDLAQTRLRELRVLAEPRPQTIAPPAPAAALATDCAVCPQTVVIPAGSFLMGSPADEEGRDSAEGPQRRVTVASFELGRTEVTQGQWKAVMGHNPSEFGECGDDCPVENVSWDDAQAYIAKLNQLSGRRYRLPSEAEWEYAVRARSLARYGFGGDVYRLDEYAWSLFNSNARTQPVGRKKPNGFGLQDMHGNVWEWVEDVWHDDYRAAPTDAPAWTSGGDQTRRVLRGGSWGHDPRNLRSATRAGGTTVERHGFTGFRIARTP